MVQNDEPVVATVAWRLGIETLAGELCGCTQTGRGRPTLAGRSRRWSTRWSSGPPRNPCAQSTLLSHPTGGFGLGPATSALGGGDCGGTVEPCRRLVVSAPHLYHGFAILGALTIARVAGERLSVTKWTPGTPSRSSSAHCNVA
jgi:hypothetical protein